MSNENEIKNPDVDHVLDPKTVVSDSDLTGLLQGIPDDTDVVSQYSDVHNMPEQGGLDRLNDETDTKKQ